MNSQNLKCDWDEVWKYFRPQKIPKNYFLMELIREYLPVSVNMRCLEVGCVPGNFLIAINRNLGYKLVGVDNSDAINKAEENLKFNNIINYELYKDDFLSFSSEKYDVICSFGFIEHFKVIDPYLDKMRALVKDGGYIVIGVPNFKIAALFSSHIRQTHNLTCMNLNFFRNQASRLGLKTVFLGYYPKLPLDRTYLHDRRLITNLFFALISIANHCLHLLDRFICLISKLNPKILLLRKMYCMYIIFIAKK